MMNETTTENDSSLVLWGEIQPNCNPFDATDRWRSMNEYQNINANCERNANKSILLSDNKALAAGDEEDMNYDPIGSHIIALRKYYLYLNQQLQLREQRKEVEKLKTDEKKGGKRIEKRKSKLVENIKLLSPPAFPQNYPFSQSFEKASLNSSRVMIKCNGEIPKHLLEKKRTIFIKRVLEQAGVLDIEDENLILNCLSAIVDEFLQKFVRLLSHNKNSEPLSKDKDLWSALETTLRNFGIGGISALHSFYYENIVKKHDILDRKCKDMYYQLQKS